MKAKELAKKLLFDIYKNLDEFSKDIIRCDLADIEFKGFYLKGKNGEKVYIRTLEDFENLEDFEVEERKYKLKNINLKHFEDGLMIINLSSKKSKNYKFEADYTITYPSYDVTAEFRERMIKWKEMDEEEMDKAIAEFDNKVNDILSDILDEVKIGKRVSAHLDVFVDSHKLENFVDEGEDIIIIWIHPAFLYSDDKILKGLLAYELSKFNKKFLEKYYKDILLYCKEIKNLTNKTPKIIEKIRNIALKYNDTLTLNLINEMEK
ncbi:hypothetical protein J422_02894 [Methanocaldococcus villosus KIN24-T80]|uniref:Uncharacterized protein n=1 Tax=Methanocaldococcus villosus KIN24-T80 TaxID=1069083 RepID=N6VR50_9EURY|nr:hypothetical protein [Methanocaldococcus villosus]ENN96385.1 hypothetical protein J422_02894 [Methanocaldococcus villosus KIN24-T80]